MIPKQKRNVLKMIKCVKESFQNFLTVSTCLNSLLIQDEYICKISTNVVHQPNVFYVLVVLIAFNSRRAKLIRTFKACKWSAIALLPEEKALEPSTVFKIRNLQLGPSTPAVAACNGYVYLYLWPLTQQTLLYRNETQINTRALSLLDWLTARLVVSKLFLCTQHSHDNV